MLESNFYEIESSKRLYAEMRCEKEKYEKLEELSYQDYINTIKRNISYTSLLYGVEKSKEWLKEEKTEAKEHYDFLCDNLEERITGRKTTVTKIIMCGWSNYATEINFTVENCDITFSLTIPNTNKLTKETMGYCNDGQLRIGYHSNDYTNEFIWVSYKEKDIKDAFEKFLKDVFENRTKELLNFSECSESNTQGKENENDF